jgi:RHS repeat-associated protein
MASQISNGQTSSFVYDADHQRVVTRTGSTTIVDFAGLAQMTVTAQGVSASRVLSMEGVTVAVRANDGTLTYPLGNHQGSIVATVPTGTGAVSRHLYDPYGAPRTPGPSVTDRGFLSQPYETSAGMSYLHHRFYEPATGVFTTVDPLVASTGTPYLYANGNPTTLSDPNGLEPGCGPSAPAGSCAAAHTSVDLLSSVAVLRREGGDAGPVNAWLATCVVAYTACRDATADRHAWLGDTPDGREASRYFRVARWLLAAFVDAGVAEVSDSGSLVGPGGGMFAPRVWFASSGRLLAESGEFDGGDWFEGCGTRCVVVTGLTGWLSASIAGAACSAGTVATGGAGSVAICAGATTVAFRLTGLAYEATSNPGLDGGDVFCTLAFGPSNAAAGAVSMGGKTASDVLAGGVSAALRAPRTFVVGELIRPGVGC